jgi:cobalt/nickel transport protein
MKSPVFASIPALPALILLLHLSPLHAHFPILVHDAELGATNNPVTVTFALGHPFELEFEPTDRPTRLQLIDQRGQATNLTSLLQPAFFRNDTNAPGWLVQFNPAPRGDHLLALDSAPFVSTTQKTLYREYVKLWLHRGAQAGWHQRTGQPLEIVPLTRPYGLRPGMVFSGRLMRDTEPIGDVEILIEHLQDCHLPPDAMPPEPLITFVVRTDSSGRFVVALPEAGWWVIGAYSDDLGTVQHQGATYRHEGFAGAWIKVESQ